MPACRGVTAHSRSCIQANRAVGEDQGPLAPSRPKRSVPGALCSYGLYSLGSLGPSRPGRSVPGARCSYGLYSHGPLGPLRPKRSVVGDLCSYGKCRYDLHSYGPLGPLRPKRSVVGALCSYGKCSYDLHSYGPLGPSRPERSLPGVRAYVNMCVRARVCMHATVLQASRRVGMNSYVRLYVSLHSLTVCVFASLAAGLCTERTDTTAEPPCGRSGARQGQCASMYVCVYVRAAQGGGADV